MHASCDETGKTERFLALYHSEHPRLYALIRTLLLTREDADEVFQETCIALWQHFDEFEPGTNFSAWAAAIARNRVLAHRKRCVRRPQQFSEEMLAQLADDYRDDLAYYEARQRALSLCLERLRATDRELLRHQYLAGCTPAQLAQRLDRPLNSLYHSLRRIRRQLQGCVRRKLRQTDEGARSDYETRS